MWRVCLIACVIVLFSLACAYSKEVHSKLKVNPIFCTTFTYVSVKCGKKIWNTLMDLVAIKKNRNQIRFFFVLLPFSLFHPSSNVLSSIAIIRFCEKFTASCCYCIVVASIEWICVCAIYKLACDASNMIKVNVEKKE